MEGRLLGEEAADLEVGVEAGFELSEDFQEIALVEDDRGVALFLRPARNGFKAVVSGFSNGVGLKRLKARGFLASRGSPDDEMKQCLAEVVANPRVKENAFAVGAIESRDDGMGIGFHERFCLRAGHDRHGDVVEVVAAVASVCLDEHEKRR